MGVIHTIVTLISRSPSLATSSGPEPLPLLLLASLFLLTSWIMRRVGAKD
jgi:hypothetical protein